MQSIQGLVLWNGGKTIKTHGQTGDPQLVILQPLLAAAESVPPSF